MKKRFIIPHTRRRIMIRSRDAEAHVLVADTLKSMGFEPAGLPKFIKHILFWWSKPKNK
jgi:hypothetical protein|tara:strand:+ start:389 stop:565 length:177 start_codon:yes stop_codon:yes gene_type:complete